MPPIESKPSVIGLPKFVLRSCPCRIGEWRLSHVSEFRL